MDYEKKYNDALERAKKSLRAANDDGRDVVGFIFPELAESEDERIRKEIINFIQSQIEDGNSAGWDRWIAWLENRKEPECLPGFDDMTPEEKMNHTLYLEGFDVGRKVGQVEAEQKPVEWSEEDERIIKILLEFIHCWGDDFFSEKEERRDCVAWLENRKEKPKTPNSIPANCASNAKSEDRHDNPGDFVCEHWKPSDEQMDALHTLLSVVPRDPALYELYEQLDKMRK